LLSLPRSGSTLVQRVLASHPQVSTVSEPWFLLPLVYSMKDKGIYAEYNHHALTLAIQDLCRQLPGGESDYRSAIRSFALDLYSSLNPGGTARYFVDKTPRYHLIVEDLFELFPDGRFVFLWRNPLAITASMVESWQKGRWNLHPYHVDLFEGLANLVHSFSKHADQACAFRYEDLVKGDASAWEPAFEYLGLDFDQAQLERFAGVELQGRMGDLVGSRHDSLTTGSTAKWQKTFRNPFRKSWCRNYLRWIGEERLAVMGYDLHTMLEELDGIETSARYLGSDVLRASYGWGVQGIRTMAVSGHHAFGDRLARVWTAAMDR
jgi:Sulfotransferase family